MSRVTDNVAYDHHPAWFPDGTKLAFTSDRDGNDDVYTVPVTGGEPTRLTWYGGGDIVLGVSPDGTKVLFRSSRRVFALDLYEVSVNGGMPKAGHDEDQGTNLEASYRSTDRRLPFAEGDKLGEARLSRVGEHEHLRDEFRRIEHALGGERLRRHGLLAVLRSNR